MQTTNAIIIPPKKNYIINFWQVIKTNRESKFIRSLEDLIFCLLETAPKNYYPPAVPPQNSITFELKNKSDINTKYRYFINQNSSEVIINHLYRLFNISFISHMDNFQNMLIKDAIYIYMKVYNLDEDCFDMLKKKYYRYKTSSINDTKLHSFKSAFTSVLS